MPAPTPDSIAEKRDADKPRNRGAFAGCTPILATSSGCDLTRDSKVKIGRARDQLLVFLAHPGAVEPTNDGSERLLRPLVIQRKMTNGYGAMRAAEGEAAISTVVDTASLTGHSLFSTILKTVGA